jgi:hypothetical protein
MPSAARCGRETLQSTGEQRALNLHILHRSACTSAVRLCSHICMQSLLQSCKALILFLLGSLPGQGPPNTTLSDVCFRAHNTRRPWCWSEQTHLRRDSVSRVFRLVISDAESDLCSRITSRAKCTLLPTPCPVEPCSTSGLPADPICGIETVGSAGYRKCLPGTYKLHTGRCVSCPSSRTLNAAQTSCGALRVQTSNAEANRPCKTSAALLSGHTWVTKFVVTQGRPDMALLAWT